MSENKFKIFVDFDGTITKTDVGEALFMEFGEREKVEHIIQNLLNDRISARESWVQLCGTISNFSKEKFDRFLTGIEIDGTFLNFVEYCTLNKFDIYVLSDGFDYYIDQIFKGKNWTI